MSEFVGVLVEDNEFDIKRAIFMSTKSFSSIIFPVSRATDIDWAIPMKLDSHIYVVFPASVILWLPVADY
ncbi:hypothetical protein AYI69_g3894 [Smittium culicis]|uniref:Uncharacterized protein n=1 Tax=Smittium culicis TaxID=133412 RepID=A0A1R1YII9_9FUNG|nr:hypothetical protein AYI69_g3894 [Smittium culicis]